MAEIFKRKTEDTYDTESIKKSLEKKDKKKEKKNDKAKKAEKKDSKKSGFKSFWHGVAEEFKRVHWPSKKDMVKYSIATIFFIIFFGIFFYVIDIIFALIQSLF